MGRDRRKLSDRGSSCVHHVVKPATSRGLGTHCWLAVRGQKVAINELERLPNRDKPNRADEMMPAQVADLEAQA